MTTPAAGIIKRLADALEVECVIAVDDRSGAPSPACLAQGHSDRMHACYPHRRGLRLIRSDPKRP
jgi:hypothetical protein